MLGYWNKCHFKEESWKFCLLSNINAQSDHPWPQYTFQCGWQNWQWPFAGFLNRWPRWHFELSFSDLRFQMEQLKILCPLGIPRENSPKGKDLAGQGNSDLWEMSLPGNLFLSHSMQLLAIWAVAPSCWNQSSHSRSISSAKICSNISNNY